MTGNFRMLRWAIEQGCPWREEELCPYATCGGTLEMIQWLRSQDVPWGTGSYEDELEDGCTEAAIRGKLDILMWAVENGCPWDPQRVLESTQHRSYSRNSEEIIEWIEEYLETH